MNDRLQIPTSKLEDQHESFDLPALHTVPNCCIHIPYQLADAFALVHFHITRQLPQNRTALRLSTQILLQRDKALLRQNRLQNDNFAISQTVQFPNLSELVGVLPMRYLLHLNCIHSLITYKRSVIRPISSTNCLKQRPIYNLRYLRFAKSIDIFDIL